MHSEITLLWNKFNKELLYFINKRIKNIDISKDILQDVFIKIHLNIDKLQNKDKIASWVYNITRNSIIDYYREKNKFKNNEYVDIEVIEDILPDQNTTKSIENLNDSLNEVYKCLLPFIEKLSPEYQNAIQSTVIEEMPQKEYAIQLGISYSGTKSRVQRAKKQLHDLFTNCCNVHIDKFGNILDFEKKEFCKCGCNDTQEC